MVHLASTTNGHTRWKVVVNGDKFRRSGRGDEVSNGSVLNGS